MSSRDFASMLSAIALTVTCTQAFAFPTQVRHQDDPMHCDQLFIPFDVDELGLGSVFPPDELIDYFSPGKSTVNPCPTHDDPAIDNPQVNMFNGTGRSFEEVWYVADPETTLSNYDGYSNDAFSPTNPGWPAFRIDHDISDPGGMNHPLVFESMTVDGIWEAGEEWRFVIQDYVNSANLPAAAFTSLGVGSASADVPGIVRSSGSIIAIPTIPEPASIALLLLFACAAPGVSRLR
ncbi:hypothetical protein [Bythopirellula goksoeyrii]|uniref:PEP-CTERM protein-sorting domain-containing protein n=1 Tax=Bythopirellula goksoeyrii TaxID=1400387 RepID=A0A5B9QA13_9BACT|nr:hypothetical protein [Bythopirellula goksoeyrii]QEG35718.1 hypothetical protein Pr1d_30210 [Bythopirellula goksoeyrii]